MGRRTTSLSANAELRELEAVRFLERLPPELGGVLIGGYAVSAYGPARYSDDVDLLFPSDQEGPASSWLARAGIHSTRTFEGREPSTKLTKLRVVQGQLSGDLFFGGLRSRATGSQVEYAWIAPGARQVTLSLLTSRLRQPVAVARPEAVWVMKLLAARRQDITDLFAIGSEPVNRAEIREKLATYSAKAERELLQRVRASVDRGDEYVDALSRRGLGSPKLPRNLKAWAKFQKIVDDVIPLSSV